MLPVVLCVHNIILLLISESTAAHRKAAESCTTAYIQISDLYLITGVFWKEEKFEVG